MQGGSDRAVQLTVNDMRRLISEMLVCRMRADYDRFATYVSPRVVVYCNAWREGIIGPEIWDGESSLRDLFRRTDENYLPLDHEILDVLADGNRAVVRWRGNWRRHATGTIYTIDAAHFLTWENGLVVEMYEFFDSHCGALPGCTCQPGFESLLTPRPPGLNREEMARRARKLVTFQAEGPNPDLVQEWFSPDIVCEFIGDRTRVPYAGRHSGIETMLGIIRANEIEFEQQTIAIQEVLVEDSRVAGRRQVKWRHRGTGRRGISELADFVRYDNGLIVELIEFRDTVTLQRLQD